MFMHKSTHEKNIRELQSIHDRIEAEDKKLIEKIKTDYELKKANDRFEEDKRLKTLHDRITDLQADLKIEKASNTKIAAEKKAEYAEHVMKVADNRVAELAKVYEGYAKNLTEVVKASHSGTGANVNTSVVTK